MFILRSAYLGEAARSVGFHTNGFSATDKHSAKTLSVRRLTPFWHSPEALARDSRRDYEAVPNRCRALMRPNAKRSFNFLRVILGPLGGRWHRDCLRCRETERALVRQTGCRHASTCLQQMLWDLRLLRSDSTSATWRNPVRSGVAKGARPCGAPLAGQSRSERRDRSAKAAPAMRSGPLHL